MLLFETLLSVWLSLTGKLGLEEYAVFYPPNGE